MWTIAPEFACYLLMAAIGLLGLLRRRVAMLGLAALALATFAATRLLPSVADALHGLGRLEAMPKLVAAFLLGACAWVWWDRLTITRTRVAIAAAVAVASLFHPVTAAILFIVAYAYVLLGYGTMRTPVVCRAARFGDFSYGIYLYAFPVQLLLRDSGWGASPMRDTVMVALLTLPLAVASWYLVERPAMQWKLRRLPTSSAHVAAVTESPLPSLDAAAPPPPPD